MPDMSDPPAHAADPLIAGLHFRGKLPHLKKEGAAYFVTFRLNDSLPAPEIARLYGRRGRLPLHRRFPIPILEIGFSSIGETPPFTPGKMPDTTKATPLKNRSWLFQ